MALFQTLKPKPKHAGAGCCLLLDVSGSMGITVMTDEEGLEPRRIDLLFRAVHTTPECAGLRAYAFSTHCRLLEVIPQEGTYEPHGGTDMRQAFEHVKSDGFFHAILVTDGEPDHAESALLAAAGMKLGIIYIGSPPVPDFLKQLAAATDGTFALADMRDIKQLEDAIVKALPAPEDETPPEGGTIAL